MIKGKIKEIIFWGITLLLPFIILGLIEVGLIIGGYNSDAQDLFIETPVNSEYLISNSEFIKRYFPHFVPRIAANSFKKEKQENTFRVFVFGGSSTQGFPYNFYYSFSDLIEQKLLLNTEGLNVEVINLGMTAVNSYVIRDLSKRVVEYEPDAVIIYAGHNEYYGSFGAASTQFGFVNNVRIKRLILWLKNFRLYQLLESVLKADDGTDTDRRTLMARVISNSDIQEGSEVFDHGIEQFESNVSDVLEIFTKQDVPVFIGTVASNLKDQAPLTDNEDASEIFSEADSLFEMGDFNGSLAKFIEAKEKDAIRFRAPEKINETLKELGTQEGVKLVDVQTHLRNNTANKIEDNSLFIDHLHPNVKGHALISELFLSQLVALQKIQDSAAPSSIDIPPTISRFESTYAIVSISRLLVGYPFTKGISQEQELDDFQRIFDRYISSSYVDSIAAVAARNQRHIPEVLTEVVNEAQIRNDTLTVVSHYYELLKWQLNSIDLIEKGIEYSVNHKPSEVYLINIILSVLNDGNYDPRYMDVLSSLYLLNNEAEKAKFWLDESERLGSDSAMLYYNFTRYYALKADSLKANEYFQKFIRAQQSN